MTGATPAAGLGLLLRGTIAAGSWRSRTVWRVRYLNEKEWDWTDSAGWTPTFGR